jgi:hypothetical protein
MNDRIIEIGKYLKEFDTYLPYPIKHATIYRSTGLEKHILKRHPECLRYINLIPEILASPDYIGVNPNESVTSFELVKVLSENIQVGIKLDARKDYLYVATLHTITTAKLKHGIDNGRLKKFDK